MENVARPDPPGGDENGVTNPIRRRIPVKLEVAYSGPDPISNHAIYEYVFRASDFNNNKNATDGSGRRGDIIVTYDDGSQIKLSDGSLKFNLLTFSPSKVDSSMNSSSRRTNVTVYYSERGHMVRDSFNVRVDLKPYFRFSARFLGNGSTFDDGSASNTVTFMYNNALGHNEVTSGVYKDENNSGLNTLKDFWQAGWNSRADGLGDQYGNENDALSALNKVGLDGKQLNTLILYANWKTNVTFDANGGVLTGGAGTVEQGFVGKTSATIPFSKNQSITTGLTGTKTNYRFVTWNTKSDGTGEDISDYSRNHNGCQGKVTFYAIYYKSDYRYTGDVQTFKAPVDGWYLVQLWGAKGGNDDYPGANGGYVSGEIRLYAGQSVYVYVGAPGADGTHGTGAGYNGGGQSGASAGGSSGSGGGASDIRLIGGAWDNYYSLSSRILVAGGGGGGGCHSGGGVGGGLVGGNGGVGCSGGTQTYAGSRGGFGYGGSSQVDGGGGGGGWYGGGASTGGECGAEGNDVGGGGGSSYIGGYGTAVTRRCSTQSGVNSGPCKVEFMLIQRL